MTTDTKTGSVRMEVTKLNMIGVWSFNIEGDCKDCGICRKNLQEPSHVAFSKGITKCNISIGKCKHAFHGDCITEYVKGGKSLCPTCKTPWEHSKELDSSQTWKRMVKTEKPGANGGGAMDNKHGVSAKPDTKKVTLTPGAGFPLPSANSASAAAAGVGYNSGAVNSADFNSLLSKLSEAIKK